MGKSSICGDLTNPVNINKKMQTAILNSLRTGVVPHIGLQHIQVGRHHETEALIQDLDTVTGGGAFVRFIIGRYGSGKTFFLNLIKTIAQEKKMIVVNADITSDQRLCGSGGKGRALYAQLMKNMSSRAFRDGDALDSVIENFIASISEEENPFSRSLKYKIRNRFKDIRSQVNAYDFADVLEQYYMGYEHNNDLLKDNALKWLRAGYTSKMDAYRELNVRSYIDDQSIIIYLKLMAHFVRMAGFKGLIVNIDEMGVLTNNLSSANARRANYEMILRIVNECNQGDAESIGIVFAGVDEFVDDPRRGLRSYEALASRLAQNPFSRDGLIDFAGPVIRLKNLTAEENLFLLCRIRHVFAGGDPEKYIVPDEALLKFIQQCSKFLGADYYQTPRDVCKAFVGFLDIINQNRNISWKAILEEYKIEKLPPVDSTHSSNDDDLESFRL